MCPRVKGWPRLGYDIAVRSRLTFGLATLAILLGSALASETAHADIVFSLNGTTLLATTPSEIGPGTYPSQTPRAYVEQRGCPAGVLVDIDGPLSTFLNNPRATCDRPLEESVDSHWIERDSVEAGRFEDVLVFDAPIVGIAADGACTLVGLDTCRSMSDYPALGSDGVELDAVRGDALRWFPSRRVLFYRFTSTGPDDWDGLRVYTQPTTATTTSADVALGCSGRGAASRFTATFDLANQGPSRARSPALVVLLPVGASVISDGGCEVNDRVLFCGDADDLEPAGADTLEVTFSVPTADPFTLRAFAGADELDPDLSNNRCVLMGGPWPGEDAGVGRLDGGGVGDGGPADFDAGPGGTTTDPVPQFRGGGGCTCRVGAGRSGGPTGPGIAFAVALAGLAVSGRRSRRSRCSR